MNILKRGLQTINFECLRVINFQMEDGQVLGQSLKPSAREKFVKNME